MDFMRLHRTFRKSDVNSDTGLTLPRRSVTEYNADRNTSIKLLNNWIERPVNYTRSPRTGKKIVISLIYKYTQVKSTTQIQGHKDTWEIPRARKVKRPNEAVYLHI